MIKFPIRELHILPVAMLAWSLLPALAQAQFTQQGAKLVGTGAVGNAYQGSSVSLSADGTTAMVGGYGDNGFAGAAWVYTETTFAGTPGHANCYGRSVSALARQYHGLNGAAAALGFPSVPALQNAILAFCGG